MERDDGEGLDFDGGMGWIFDANNLHGKDLQEIRNDGGITWGTYSRSLNL